MYHSKEQSYFSSIYPTCLGANHALGDDSIHFIGLSAIFIGIGEIGANLIQLSKTAENYRGYAYWYVSILYKCILLARKCVRTQTKHSIEHVSFNMSLSSMVTVFYYIACVISFLMLPNSCSLRPSLIKTDIGQSRTLVSPKLWVFLLCSLLLGIYDTTSSTIVESLICESISIWKQLTLECIY